MSERAAKSLSWNNMSNRSLTLTAQKVFLSRAREASGLGMTSPKRASSS